MWFMVIFGIFFDSSTPQFSKPVMEKRRRERINQSLETLRLLMLENTDSEVKTCAMLLFLNPLNTSNSRLIFRTSCTQWMICTLVFVPCLESEESKGGEGRDLGQCGPLPEDKERGEEGSPGPEQRAGTCMYPPAQLPWRHEGLPDEGQPLHSQQEPGVRGDLRGGSACFSRLSRTPDPPFIPRGHVQGADPLSCSSVSSTSATPARHVPSIPHPGAWPPLWHQGYLLLHRRLHARHRSRVEALASVTDTWCVTDFIFYIWLL